MSDATEFFFPEHMILSTHILDGLILRNRYNFRPLLSLDEELQVSDTRGAVNPDIVRVHMEQLLRVD